jgi:hypothetical protein
VVQTQDLTVFNITKEAVVARQAKVSDQFAADCRQAARGLYARCGPAYRLVGRGTHISRLSPGIENFFEEKDQSSQHSCGLRS